MLAKNNSVQQQPPRRTPLSLSTSMKPVKPNDKNDNNKKEPINNQKTENSKKDSQSEKKLSADKKQSSTESKRSSSTSSTDSKKLEGTKINKNEDNKKSQNGVNGNGIKEKSNTPNANEGKVKNKPESSSNGSATPKKESQKPIEKKKDPAVVVEVALKNDNKDKPTEKIKEIKDEENKNKSAEKNKEKNVDISNTTKLDQEKSSEVKEEVKVAAEKKMVDEKVNEEKNPEKTAIKETNIIEPEVTKEVIDCDEDSLPLISLRSDETTVLKTPNKEKKDENAPILENPLPEDNLLDDVVMMEPLQFTEEPTSCNIFAVSTPAKTCSPKEAQILFENPSKLSPKSEVKPAKAPLTHTPDRKSCPRTFSSISGRRSIRPIGDYTFSGNLQIRESYRKINTELDFTSSSLNVTVGSEVPNNESFSFFSRSRKRDRSSPSHQSAMDVQSELSPKSPKRARIDMGMHGFFNAMASPITMLRARLARASVQSTPKKQIVDSIEQEIVENVSAIAVEAVDEDLTATEEQTFNPDSTVADTNEQCEEPAKCSQSPVIEKIDDIKIKETITATDSQAKKKCSIM